MLESSNPSIDIDALLERIHQEVTRQKSRQPAVNGHDRFPALTLGSVLHFGNAGNAIPFLRTGWSHPEAEHHWTEGREAEIDFEIPDRDVDVVLAFQVFPMVGGKTGAQHVQTEWNGALVGEWSIRQAGTYATIVWSRHLAASRSVRLRFVLHDAFSPVSAGLNADPRVLGLCFRELRLLPVSDIGA